MIRRGWSCLLLGFFLTTAVACRSLNQNENPEQIGTEPTPIPTPAAAIDQTPTGGATLIPLSTSTFPPLPSPSPTTNVFKDWQWVGSDSAGLQMAVPPGWINLSDELDATATSPLGLPILFAVDGERTGETALAGKPVEEGALVVGLVDDFVAPAEDAAARLDLLLAETLPESTAVDEMQAVTAVSGAEGAYVDVSGHPIPLFHHDGLRTRLYLFPLPIDENAPVEPTQVLLLLSAPASAWEDAAPTFDLMAETISTLNTRPVIITGNGPANMQGDLQTQSLARGNLAVGAQDVWTFSVTAPAYANLTLSPDEENPDLSLTIISPSGETVAQIDNGFAGDTERAADLLLSESGLYLVEVKEFNEEMARYTLSLILTDTPLFRERGEIEIGQSIQAEMLPDSLHIWSFDGLAGQVVSVVLMPQGEPFDAILDLYGPDGRRLAALDEGFSGDAEVISGFRLNVTGEYAIMVRSFADEGGAYTLSLDEGGEATLNFYDAGDLAYGSTLTETLLLNEAHAWFFNGRAGDEIQINVQPLSEGLDLDLWLLDPDINRIATSDAALTDEAETIQRTLSEDGQYLILVRDFYGEPGVYEVALSAQSVQSVAVSGMIKPGETMLGTLAANQDAAWVLDGRVGDPITIQLDARAEDDDLVLRLVNPNGQTVAEIDNALAGQSEILPEFILGEEGEWQIIVSEFFDEPAEYRLTVNSP